MSKHSRKPSGFNKCVSRELRGELKGKSASARQRMFAKAAEKCAR